MSYPTTLTQAQNRNSVAGTCNTNDTAITRVTGDSFTSIVCGFIEIGGSVDQPGILYEISSITDADHLILSSSAGVQNEIYFTAALEIKAIHLNALEAKVGVDDSAVVTSLDYLLKNAASVDPGHKHTTSVLVAVGSLYCNSGTNPATELGYGTWIADRIEQ